jgi:hypothetical protein
MADYKNLTAGDLGKGIAETRAALKRANELIEKVGLLGAEKPSIWAALADSTARLREHLEEDLASLEKALTEATRR